MTLKGHGRLLEYENSRTLIYVSQDLVKDSAFPFEAGQKLRITIEPDKQRLVVERAHED